ncbi:calcium-transporting ATPase 5, plasma membrane-type-like [Miscanthus floridulus]|uniref:calcium-transporting ATPase 5, plasma membrane-type-like n=1 Tax=Miscanthus floridulus TaxID=154761 RepID=UPI003459B845
MLLVVLDTLDLEREEEKENLRRMLRSHAQVIRAVFLFKEAGQKNLGEYCTNIKDETLSQRFSVDLKKLKMLNRDHDTIIFQEVGGVKGLSDLLKSDLDEGVSPDENELMRRRDIFGANTYPRKERRSIWYFVFEACQDLTLVILMVAAAISLSLGMATEGVKDGWYDGGSIFFAVFLVIFVTATSDYRQSLQFQHLNEEKRNIQVELASLGLSLSASTFSLRCPAVSHAAFPSFFLLSWEEAPLLLRFPPHPVPAIPTRVPRPRAEPAAPQRAVAATAPRAALPFPASERSRTPRPHWTCSFPTLSLPCARTIAMATPIDATAPLLPSAAAHLELLYVAVLSPIMARAFPASFHLPRLPPATALVPHRRHASFAGPPWPVPFPLLFISASCPR